MSKRKNYLKASRRLYIGLILVALVLYAVVPQLADFHSSIATLAHAALLWLVFGVLLIAVSFGFAALTYRCLTGRRVEYGGLLEVQVANGFAGKLLPLGAGGIGLNVLYLQQKLKSGSRAAAVVTLNNLLGFIGNMLLLAVCLLLGAHLQLKINANIGWFVVIGALALLAAFVLYHVNIGVERRLNAYFKLLGAVMRRPWAVLSALISSIGLTLCLSAAFWCCCRATGLPASFIDSFLVFTFGMAVAAGTPTPGGIGGAEAALTGGLIALGYDSGTSLAAALAYRALSYWLPMISGYIAFRHIGQPLLAGLANSHKIGHNRRHA